VVLMPSIIAKRVNPPAGGPGQMCGAFSRSAMIVEE